jgi:hypothetical protein
MEYKTFEEVVNEYLECGYYNREEAEVMSARGLEVLQFALQNNIPCCNFKDVIKWAKVYNEEILKDSPEYIYPTSVEWEDACNRYVKKHGGWEIDAKI